MTVGVGVVVVVKVVGMVVVQRTSRTATNQGWLPVSAAVSASVCVGPGQPGPISVYLSQCTIAAGPFAPDDAHVHAARADTGAGDRGRRRRGQAGQARLRR